MGYFMLVVRTVLGISSSHIGSSSLPVDKAAMILTPDDHPAHVLGTHSRDGFAMTGYMVVADMCNVLLTVKRPMKSFKKLLDFDCGRGRSEAKPMNWLEARSPDFRFSKGVRKKSYG